MDKKILEGFGFFKELNRLKRGLCPECGRKPDLSLMNDLELAEFNISGLCKRCQIKIFGEQ